MWMGIRDAVREFWPGALFVDALGELTCALLDKACKYRQGMVL